jgi:hypothetical protein
MENETKMETVYSKLKRMESLIQQVPEDARTLYRFRVFHNESDFVGIGFDNGMGHHIGFSSDVAVRIEIRNTSTKFYCVDVRTPGVWITLYCGGENTSSHTILL